MIIVTGAAGFIGANLVHTLNARGERDIVAVADQTGRSVTDVAAILHQGACSDTMESDGRYMMENNYRYSMRLLEFTRRHGIPFIYASSAAVYGGSARFVEDRACERPLNVYGYSKFLFDQVRQPSHVRVPPGH